MLLFHVFCGWTLRQVRTLLSCWLASWLPLGCKWGSSKWQVSNCGNSHERKTLHWKRLPKGTRKDCKSCEHGRFLLSMAVKGRQRPANGKFPGIFNCTIPKWTSGFETSFLSEWHVSLDLIRFFFLVADSARPWILYRSPFGSTTAAVSRLGRWRDLTAKPHF